jgi:diacylglycerol kinase
MKGFFNSFHFAFRGIRIVFKGRNFSIQFALFLFTIFLGICFGISQTEWIFLFISSGFVLGSEALNTAIETFCDLYTTEFDPKIKDIKDIAAGAVLIFSLFALIVGICIFSKYLF